MKRGASFIIKGLMVCGLMSVSIVAQEVATLEMGKIVRGKFYYDQTKPLYHNPYRCNKIYGQCSSIKACGYVYYYPKLRALVYNYLKASPSRAVGFISWKYRSRTCIITHRQVFR